MKKLLIAIFLILEVSMISASCNSTQVNINSANLTELDKIITIGPATANKIITARPFSSLDDLLKVSGIGNVTLTKIKSQGLACVEEEIVSNTQEEQQAQEAQEPTTQDNSAEETVQKTSAPVLSPQIQNDEETTHLEVIKLDTQNIKTNNENGNYAIYGFIGFCILLAVLFILNFRHRRREEKNEFR